MPDRDLTPSPTRDLVALTLAIGAATALNLITIGVLIAAWFRGQRNGDYALSENATQVLIAAFGGFIGILGGYVGGSAVARARQQADHSQQARAETAAALPTSPLEVEFASPVEVVEVDPDRTDRPGSSPG